MNPALVTINARHLLLLMLIPLLLSLQIGRAAKAQANNSIEYDWSFDVKEDLSVIITGVVTIHPSSTWSSNRLTWNPPGTLSSFAAYDYSTGASLQFVTTTTTNGGTTYLISFPTDETDGYRYRIELRASNLPSRTSSGFSLDFGWGGSTTPTPQDVRIDLPPGYNVATVTNTDSHAAIQYTASWDGTRVNVAFQGTAPANGYFDWELVADTTSQLPLAITVVNTITSTMVSTVSRPDVGTEGFAGLFGALAGFIIAFVASRNRSMASTNAREDSRKYCTRCGSGNAPENAFCGGCGHPFDVTRVYE